MICEATHLDADAEAVVERLGHEHFSPHRHVGTAVSANGVAPVDRADHASERELTAGVARETQPGLAVAIQTNASLRPAHDALKAALAWAGVALPSVAARQRSCGDNLSRVRLSVPGIEPAARHGFAAASPHVLEAGTDFAYAVRATP